MEFSFARTVYLEAVRAGVALNKWGRPYRPRSAESLAGRSTECRVGWPCSNSTRFVRVTSNC